MNFEIKLHLNKNLRVYKVSIHIKFLKDEILKKIDMQEKFFLNIKINLCNLQ